MIPSAVLENGDNIPGVTRYEPIPVCSVAVESQIKTEVLSKSITSADHTSFEPVRAVRVAQLIYYLGILCVTKGPRFTHGSKMVAGQIGDGDRDNEGNNHQRNDG